MKRIGVLLLSACRTLYCWMFLLWSLFGVHWVYTRIQDFARTHLIEKGEIRSVSLLSAYYLVFGMAWWMILRRKPALTKWAITANLILIFFWWPPLLTGNWRLFWENERRWWPVILIGTLGIIIFSIPYYGWRHETPVSTD